MLINPISIYSTENKRCYGTKNAKCNKSNANVNLYQGYNNSVLWIDSSQQMAIKQACRMINKIRQLDLFKNVSKVQCPKPDVNITNFYPIGFYTKDGTIIYERMI